MVVFGEAGMGKSRLVYEFLNQIPPNTPPGSWRNRPAAARIAQPVPLLAAALLRHRRAGRGRAQPAQFRGPLDELRLRCPKANWPNAWNAPAPFWARWLGCAGLASLYEQFDAEARYQNTLLGLTALLQAESLRQPVILFLEDIHWLDEDSAAYLPRLLRALTSTDETRYPVALIATSRPDETRLPLADLPHAEITLERLDPEGLKQLTESLLHGPAGAALLHLLEARAEGNPFFAERCCATRKKKACWRRKTAFGS